MNPATTSRPRARLVWECRPAAASPFHTRPARAAGREKRSFPMAIDDLLDEHEQSERVLAWLRSNGAGLIGGVILGLALIIGWQWWGSRQASADMQAGNDYQAMLDSLGAKDITKNGRAEVRERGYRDG